ncbi:DciA family protein [Streptomyces sp. NPDC093509]|uniref:DciA family protein n=1 Tax=Streptomyces sp. NPDC093509 TaxID=3154982 RepID=UPI00344C7D13
MTDTPQMAGRDLARQALAAYKATASTAPARPVGRAKKKRVTRAGSARDPISLAAAITALGADIPMDAGIAGGNVLAQWTTLCPQFAGLVQPVSYDEHTGRLDLRPSSHAYASQLRLLGGQLARRINDKAGRTVVRTIRVLPVGAVDQAVPAPPVVEEQPAEQAPVKTRDTASPGYQQARQAHLAARQDLAVNMPGVTEAIERQNRFLTNPANREPETAFADAVAEQERLAGPALSASEKSRRAALAYKRTGKTAEPRRAFDVA